MFTFIRQWQWKDRQEMKEREEYAHGNMGRQLESNLSASQLSVFL